MKSILFILTLLCWIPLASGQLPAACGGGSSPAIACNQACINCNFNGYTGNTTGFPSGFAPEFCGTIENAQWLGFIAGEATATFIITPTNCTNNNGVQVALYSDCTAAPLACDKGMKNGGGIPVSIATQLAPGANYYLLIDGYAGDQCDFTVTVSPASAVYQPPLGDIQPITGPNKACPGATFTYSVPPVFGAGAYIWTGPPGTLFDSVPTPATLSGEKSRTVLATIGNESGNICVQAANTCSQTPPCASSIYVEVLDESFRPKIELDTVQHLNCLNPAVALEVNIIPPGNYAYAWTADSLGNIVNNAKSAYPAVNKVGTYFMTVTNPINGCSNTASVRVDHPDLTTAADLNIQHISCNGFNNGTIGVREVLGGKGPYLYSIDGKPASPISVFSYLTPGDHLLQVEGANGCVWDSTVTILEPDVLVLDLGPDVSVQLGDAIPLWNLSDLNDPERLKTLSVEPAYLTVALCDTCKIRPLNSLRYSLTVRDSNGCIATDERIIAVEKKRRVYFPNIFNPDNPDDGQMFSIFCGQDVAQVRYLKVQNRWGQTVFEQQNFAPNDNQVYWDGRVEGKKLPPDVFVYFAEVQFRDGMVEQFQGDVTLIR
jgi:hypothetical protein